MKKKLNVGIIGCGAIGSSLAEKIVKVFFRQARVAAVYDMDHTKSLALSRRFVSLRNTPVKDTAQLFEKSDLVIEAASARSSWQIARKAITSGCDVMIMSVGGIVDHFDRLSSLSRKHNVKVYIPSGAIAGIDGLKAASLSGLKKVVLTTRKNPFSFKGVAYIEKRGIDLSKIKKDTLLFSGSAQEAVKLFPQNINVAAILSIAGMGSDKTKVCIVASPSVDNNIHEIEIESSAGRIFTRSENVLHPDNPKTSFLAVLSAQAVLESILSPVRIGA